MTFHVIDTKTGKEPTDRVLTNIARKGGLMEMDIDGFYVGEEGELVLVDDCGNATWIDPKRFKVVVDVLDKIRAEIELLSNANPSYWHSGDMVEREEVLDIIDKYKGDKE